MSKKTQRIVVVIVLAALILSVLVPALSILADGAVTQGEIDSLKDSLSDIARQRREVQQQLNAVRGDLSRAREQVNLIESELALTEHQVTESQRLLDQYDLAIQANEEEVARLEEQEARQYEEFYDQVRWMEETGNVSYLSILFQASSFSELLDYAMLVGDIMEYSDRIITDLEATQQELGEAREELQANRDQQAEAQTELQAHKEELLALREEATAALNEIAASESAYASVARQLAADEAKINRELREAEQTYAAQIANLNNNTGDWYWPLPGRYKLSSLFGARADPFTGRADNHTGTDIPAPGGTEIHAAQGGVVTTVGTNRYSSYGYYCIINHGNGRSTLYAHMRSIPIVQVGQTVDKGQVIGYVGTTGRSTGNHLHFELRVNGVRGDVLTLYPGVTFTSPRGATINGG